MRPGVLTFLFSDIEESTKLWEHHPEAMGSALQQHDELLRASIEENRGGVFKTVGDAFCATFSDPADALRAAIAAQKGTREMSVANQSPIKIRIAIHSGTAESRDGDYFGPTLNRVARLLSIGHGGQTLISAATQELAKDRVPPGATLLDLGVHRLRDLGSVEQVYQLCHPDLAIEFAPIRSLQNPELRHNLPHQVTTFIGRESELQQVVSMVCESRLVTLTGSGGCGKTRLALQAAMASVGGYEDGVWQVELAALADPNLVPSTIAAVLRAKEEPGSTIEQTLVRHLKHKHTLLLLDNCEHVLDACASVTEAIVRDCPKVHILATSREALGFVGERSFRVPSLPLPSIDAIEDAATISRYDSVRLFVERASAHQSGFTITDENAKSVAAVCSRLDGIPLALELAAARVRSMSVEEINHRLDQRFRLLTGGSRSALPRQQTLRSLIDWSYDLLSGGEKSLLVRLSVFSGGWTLDSAEVVCSGSGHGSVELPPDEVADLLDALVGRSLVLYDPESGRYRLLETVRQYAREKLIDGSYGEDLRNAHLFHFVNLCGNAEPELHRQGQRGWLGRLEAEHDNLRSALDWAHSTEHGEALSRLVACLDLFWVVTNRFREGNRWVERALSMQSDVGPLVRSRVLEGGTMLTFFQGDMEGATSRARASLASARESGDAWQTSLALFMVGIAAVHADRLEEAADAALRGMELAEELESPFLVGRHLVLKALDAWVRGSYADARDAFTETIEISRRLGDVWHVGISLANSAFVTRLAGDSAKAASVHADGLVLSGDVGDWQAVTWHLVGMAGVLTSMQDVSTAAQLLGAADSLMTSIGSRLPLHQQRDWDETLGTVRRALGEPGFQADFDVGSRWNAGNAMAQALAAALRCSPLSE